MNSLLLATTNPGKIKEFKKLLAGRVPCREAYEPIPKIIEDGKTYQENALKKAQAFYEIYQGPVLADDSGLEVDVLRGQPGIHSARFGGENIDWTERFAFLFTKLSDYPPDLWTARFRCVLCLYSSQGTQFFEETCEGKIVPVPSGANGFGYDPLFFSFDLNKTFGDASEAEKSQVSHRAKAIRALGHWLEKNSLPLS